MHAPTYHLHHLTSPTTLNALLCSHLKTYLVNVSSQSNWQKKKKILKK